MCCCSHLVAAFNYLGCIVISTSTTKVDTTSRPFFGVSKGGSAVLDDDICVVIYNIYIYMFLGVAMSVAVLVNVFVAVYVVVICLLPLFLFVYVAGMSVAVLVDVTVAVCC